MKIKNWVTGETMVEIEGDTLERAYLTRANLTRANLTRAKLNGADLTGANLTRAKLNGADLTGANLCMAELSWAKLIGANLTGAKLNRTNLTGANLTGANLARADLIDADLTGANLTRARLVGADLERANLNWTNFRKAKYDDTTIFPTGFDPERRGLIYCDNTKLVDQPSVEDVKKYCGIYEHPNGRAFKLTPDHIKSGTEGFGLGKRIEPIPPQCAVEDTPQPRAKYEFCNRVTFLSDPIRPGGESAAWGTEEE